MSYTHLSKDERKCIHRWRVEGVTIANIAGRLARARSTIYRELKRNALGPNSYVGEKANTMYRKRIRWPRRRPKRDDQKLVNMVESRLKKLWSPEQISNHFRYIAYASTPARWISHGTIYRHTHEMKNKNGRLHTFLRRYGNLRPKRYGSGLDGRGRIADRILIDERPNIVDQQIRAGDWEGDTLHGPGRKGSVVTFVDRMTLYTLALWMPDRTSASLIAAAKTCFRRIPQILRHTMTVDNGPEFRSHKALSRAISMPVYFAHPYAPWERPINENTNGLLRQFIPKKQPLNEVTHKQVKHAVDALNHRPRKKLGYRTPHEVFWAACRT